MSMSVAEARAEIASLFTQASEIESKYADGVITNNEDEAEVKRLLTEIDGLETKLGALEATEQRRERVTKGLRDYQRPSERMRHPVAGDPDPDAGKSIGQMFVEHSEYQRYKSLGLLDSPNNTIAFSVPLVGAKAHLIDEAIIQRKALVYSGTGSAGTLIQPDRLPGVVPLDQRERTLLDIVARSTTDSDLIEYIRMATFTNNAVPVAEASVTTGTTGVKPESAVTMSKVQAPVKTIAHWMPVTNKMLADAPAIRGVIDQHLLIGLELEVEDQIISGDGTGENLTGILSAGIQSYGAASSANVADAILHARALVRVVGKTRPNAVVMHPYDWEAVRIMRENSATGTLGGYLLGPPSVAGPMTLWGMTVLEAEGISENTALVGDFLTGGMLFEREQAQIRVGLINDQFVRNMQTILAEVRVAWATFKPSAYCQVTGV